MSEIEKPDTSGSVSGLEYASPLNRAVTPGGHPLDTSQPAFPVYHRKLGDPAPLGLFMFALTTFTLSWYNTGVRGITHPNVVVGMTLAVGGLGQFLSGMWNFATGNTFAATVFSAYGTFWISFGVIYLPGSGILGVAYKAGELESALGIYLMTWWLMTVIVLLGTLKSSLELFLTILLLKFTFLMLAIGQFQQSLVFQQAGGGLGIATALLAMYTGASGILTADTSYFTLPTYDLAALAKRRAQRANPGSNA